MRTIILVGSLAVIVGCAITYKSPMTRAEVVSSSIVKSNADILRISKRVLVSDGNQVTNSDEAAGTISTAPRNLRLTPEQADCGTTMGIDYLKDNRTSTRVAYGILAEENNLTIKANIEGEYKPGDAMQNITLSCVSRGVLERELLGRIVSQSN